MTNERPTTWYRVLEFDVHPGRDPNWIPVVTYTPSEDVNGERLDLNDLRLERPDAAFAIELVFSHGPPGLANHGRLMPEIAEADGEIVFCLDPAVAQRLEAAGWARTIAVDGYALSVVRQQAPAYVRPFPA